MSELGVADFHADRDGLHDIFKKDNQAITRTAHGSLRFAREKTRHCRDVPCLILFLLYWVGMVVVASIALDKGVPERLLYATDYQGHTCGRGEKVDTKLIYYP